MQDLEDLCTAKERYTYYRGYVSSPRYRELRFSARPTDDDIFKFQVTETNLKAIVSTFDITTTCEEVTSGHPLPGIAKLVAKPDASFIDIVPSLFDLGALVKEPVLRVLSFKGALSFAKVISRFPLGMSDDYITKLRDLAYTPLEELYIALKDDNEVYASILQSFIDGTDYDLDMVYQAYRSRVPLKEAN